MPGRPLARVAPTVILPTLVLLVGGACTARAAANEGRRSPPLEDAFAEGKRYEFTVDVGEDTLVFRWKASREPSRGEGTWRRGGKELGTRTYDAELVAAYGKLELLSRPTAEEERASWDAYHGIRKTEPWRAASARVRAAEDAREVCLPSGGAGGASGCAAQREELASARAALEAVEAPLAVDVAPFGCRSVTLWPEAGAVTGHAMACAGHPSLAPFEATGRYAER